MAKISIAFCIVLCVALMYIASPTAGAKTTYLVSVDTSPLYGQLGDIDIQFNPGTLGNPLPASLYISNFSTDGMLAPTSTNTGDVAGNSLGSSVVMQNDTAYNDVYQGLTYGNAFSFNATLTGPALSPTSPFPASSTGLFLSLYDASGTTSLLTTNPADSIVNIAVNTDGSTTVTPYADANGVFRATATLTPSISSIPEPSRLTW